MLKTVSRLLLILAVLGVALAWLLLRDDRAGWRWLSHGGWHTTARISTLTPQEREWAAIAWRYFENNTQDATGLVNGSDKRPVVSLWQIGDSLIALTAARELNLIDEKIFDERLTRLLGTLNRLPLTPRQTPNRLYSTWSPTMVDFTGKPGVMGWSARDMARLMLALRLVAQYHPQYSEYLERVVMRWNFCPVIDQDGTLYAAQMQNGLLTPRDEIRLGESEYAAAGFSLWGFQPTKAWGPPSQNVILYDRALPVDARDPRTTWQPSLITTLPYTLPGLEFGWEVPGVDRAQIDNLRERAKLVYLSQESRWQQENILTARADFSTSAAPWHASDTVWANGYPWNTLGDDGKEYPRLAQVSTKAVFSLWVLWDTPYTDALMQATRLMYDEKRGWYEGRVEATGDYNRSLTLSTNATVLEALFYKANGGPLLASDTPAPGSYFSRRLSDVFNPLRQCLPGESRPEVRP
ncbi:DUF3131 domain-containing protein [Cronobacter sakazakii]|uniref:DUF3131 domain-containing protein n=1 Tax=Cronobacter sakazakii TaxID=28141 RepID=UPI000CFD5EDD|nr:DUF3131 domain-containing protein [Cronobacter sakazakii]ELY2588640.1 DUF3131 domain-containing protein [Cronobacter sakazakii]STD10093.1 Protein of uncharacterised function (DUF3131) [Cronobacter sakazakii]